MNSLTKIKEAKNFTNYDLNSLINNTHNSSSNNNNNYKVKNNNCRKNLVLNKLNSNTNMIYNNKNKLLKEDININKSSSLHKSSDYVNSKVNLTRKISNSHSFKPIKPTKANNSKNINLNFNLNINFNIDVENKNKRKKILLNNAIVNQLQNKIIKNQKYTNVNQNKDNIHQYPLTSKNSKNHLKDFNDFNKFEYTILKKAKPKI